MKKVKYPRECDECGSAILYREEDCGGLCQSCFDLQEELLEEEELFEEYE